MNKDIIINVLEYIKKYCDNSTCRDCYAYKTICCKNPCNWDMEELEFRFEQMEDVER